MQIIAKSTVLTGMGLILLLVVIGLNVIEHRSNDKSTSLTGQEVTAGENINGSDTQEWFEEYESDGTNAGGISANILPAKKVILAALLLIVTAGLAAGVKGPKSDHTKQISDE